MGARKKSNVLKKPVSTPTDMDFERPAPAVSNSGVCVTVGCTDKVFFMGEAKVKGLCIKCYNAAQDNLDSLDITTAPSSPQELPSPGPERHLESSRRLFGIEDYTCLLRIAFWLFVAILLAILCTILVRYYRRRGRINGYVFRAVHNFKRSVRFVSEKHKPFRREDLVIKI